MRKGVSWKFLECEEGRVKEDGEGVAGKVPLPGVDDVAVATGRAAANDGRPAGVVDRDLCPE
jgi:hypothetical protein